MLDDKGPLLFINSVTTDAEANNQQVYDTRNPPKHNSSYKDLKKLKNIIEMFQKNRPVLCNLITKANTIKATPMKIEQNKLYIRNEEGIEEQIDITELQDIEIIKF